MGADEGERNRRGRSWANLWEWTRTDSFGYGYGNHHGVWECPNLVFPTRPYTRVAADSNMTYKLYKLNDK